MWLFDRLFGISTPDHDLGLVDEISDTSSHHTSVNPATGLPMLDDSIDVAGNPFGTDINSSLDASSLSHDWISDSSSHDSFSSSGFGGSDFD